MLVRQVDDRSSVMPPKLATTRARAWCAGTLRGPHPASCNRRATPASASGRRTRGATALCDGARCLDSVDLKVAVIVSEAGSRVARWLHVTSREGDHPIKSPVDAGGAGPRLDAENEHYRERVVLIVAVDRRTSARPEMTEDLLEIAKYGGLRPVILYSRPCRYARGRNPQVGSVRSMRRPIDGGESAARALGVVAPLAYPCSLKRRPAPPPQDHERCWP